WVRVRGRRGRGVARRFVAGEGVGAGPAVGAALTPAEAGVLLAALKAEAALRDVEARLGQRLMQVRRARLRLLGRRGVVERALRGPARGPQDRSCPGRPAPPMQSPPQPWRRPGRSPVSPRWRAWRRLAGASSSLRRFWSA